MCYEVTHEKDMQNLKIKRDCGRARNAQGSPKAGARAIFVQNNVAQPPHAGWYVRRKPDVRQLQSAFSNSGKSNESLNV